MKRESVMNIKNLDTVASQLKSMGHPKRIFIIKLLEASSRMSVVEIAKALGVLQSEASHHLNLLKNKGILNSERVGKNSCYFVSHPNIISAINNFLDLNS